MENQYKYAEEMNFAAGNCLQKGDYFGALEFFSKALESLPENFREARAQVYCNVGHTLVTLQNFEDALTSFANSAELFQQMGRKIETGEQFGNIGSVYRDIEEWDKSLDVYFKALDFFKDVGYERGVADQYSNIAYSYSKKGEPKNAYYFFVEAKVLYDKLGNIEKAQLCEQNLQAIKACLEG